MTAWPPEGWEGKLLTDASPLQLLPDLAVAVGLNESLMLQQLHYWTRHGGDGDGWIAKTLSDWEETLPFMHRDTIKRAGKRLRKLELVEVSLTGRTNSYRLRYDKLAKIKGGQFAPIDEGQIAPVKGADCTHKGGKMHPSTNKEQRKRQRKAKPRRDAPGADQAPLSHLLADLIAANDPNDERPTVTQRWAEAEDRLQRLDHRPAAQVEVVIRWVQADEFWMHNILSMPKLREKYRQVVGKALTEQPERGNRASAKADDDIAKLREARERLEREGR